MPDYEVRVVNIFQADSPEDAVMQMAGWLVDSAYQAGYRVTNLDTRESVFIDAEKIGDIFND